MVHLKTKKNLKMSLRPIYQITDEELFHTMNEIVDETYTVQLFFKNAIYYKECLQRLQNKFEVEAEGLVVLADKSVYKISVLCLTRGEGNTTHGFVSYIYLANYIRVYWNNKQKKILFYAEQ